MILSGRMIEYKRKLGKIEIDPYNHDHLGPNSYDVTLGPKILVYNPRDDGHIHLDTRRPNPTSEIIIKGEIVFHPGILYLAHTNERAGSDHYVPMIEGRSSLARLGIMIHQTGGFGDVGFKRQWTLEITVTHPVTLYLNMRIAQVYFINIDGEFDLYKGKYVNSDGVEASKIHEDERSIKNVRTQS